MSVDLAELATKANRVAAAKTEGDEARAAIDAAEAELLERVVEAIRPALPALCSKVEGLGALRVLRVAGPSPHTLYLTSHGLWLAWAAVDETKGLSTEDVLDEWALFAIIESIARSLESHDNGNAASTAEKMRERAERIRAVATLLGGGK